MASKELSKVDVTGEDLSRRALMGDPSFANNFDRIHFDNVENRWVIFEYSKCDQEQFDRGVTPWTSHPNRYWHKGSNKFRLLWKLAQELSAIFYIVNYTDPDCKFGDEIRIIRVEDVTEKGLFGPTKECSFQEFSDWFRRKNAAAGKPRNEVHASAV